MWTMCLLKIVVLRNCDDYIIHVTHYGLGIYYSLLALHVQGGPSGSGQPFVDISAAELLI